MRDTKQPEVFVERVEPFLRRDENNTPVRDELNQLIVDPPERIAHLVTWASDLYADKDACGMIDRNSLSAGELALLRGITQGYALVDSARQKEPHEKA